jgi:oxygen-independent coproporphyrinogen-3 oxidase
VPGADLPFEFLMNTLRLVEGFEEHEFEQRTGLERKVLTVSLTRLRARGLMEQHEGRWRASALGFSFLNDVVSEFLAPQR